MQDSTIQWVSLSFNTILKKSTRRSRLRSLYFDGEKKIKKKSIAILYRDDNNKQQIKDRDHQYRITEETQGIDAVEPRLLHRKLEGRRDKVEHSSCIYSQQEQDVDNKAIEITLASQ